MTVFDSNKPVAQAVSHLIHETNRFLYNLNTNISEVKNTPQRQRLKAASKAIETELDKFYLRIKALPESITDQTS
jgi:hypothetical protein